MECLFWPALGAIIGIGAAYSKGHNMVAFGLGGALLGPLALLLFFASGVASSKERQVKCPHCAEWVKPEANVCKHCHRNLPMVGAR
ncbi:MAG TPA: DUF2614 family zinc ribbon-containing protein [Thermoanaerobaculia bacterium]|nr:DUF2614 family zinc ribbon-containing protein [Thermoanaerobaculia bacterium]